jgi:single-stranded-DNA-specific exonuclease
MFPEIRRRVADAEPELPGVSPVLRRIYAARGVSAASELAYDLEQLPRFADLAGIERAVELLADAIIAGERIVVVGDYDADGATSCAVAVRALRGFGAADVRTKVPNRFTDGYGLTASIVEEVGALGASLLMTVDNGVASVEGVAAARRRGIRVVVTDHHLPGPELPAADALVNPNQSGDRSELGYLAGVGVTYLLMVALRAGLRQRDWFARQGIEEPNLGDLLDLVALGTVADVVPLRHGNRLLVHQGLRRLRGGRGQPGLRALVEVAGRRPERLSEIDLGYVLGPRLNAAGRLTDMELGVRCLLAESLGEALEPARELDRLNRERRAIEARMEAEAVDALEDLALESAGEDLPAGLCLFEESWHQGVVGIVASRLKDRWHRPVIAFAPGGDGELRGSARSVAAVHVRDVIETVANRHPGLVERFGGHAMAAGVTLARDRLEPFRAAFAAEVDRVFPLDERRGVVHTDGELGANELGLALAREIRAGGPWGRGFPEPSFDGRFTIVERRPVGDGHLKMRLRPAGGDATLDAIVFRQTDDGWPDGPLEAQAIYRLEINEYRGFETPQLVLSHLRLV